MNSLSGLVQHDNTLRDLAIVPEVIPAATVRAKELAHILPFGQALPHGSSGSAPGFSTTGSRLEQHPPHLEVQRRLVRSATVPSFSIQLGVQTVIVCTTKCGAEKALILLGNPLCGNLPGTKCKIPCSAHLSVARVDILWKPATINKDSQ